MPLTLTQETMLNELAHHLYRFLPGKAHPYANQNISFEAKSVSVRCLGNNLVSCPSSWCSFVAP